MKQPHSVLVLNKGYAPVQITSWQDAMSQIYTEKARPLDQDFVVYSYNDWIQNTNTVLADYNKVHTIKYTIAIPEIILLSNYNRLPIKMIKYSKPNCFLRDKYRCGYCGKQFKEEELTADHIFPRDRGGQATWENIISSCFPCNQKKANRTPDEAGMKLRFKPINPKWTNPLDKMKAKIHPCKSWEKFMDRIDTQYTQVNKEIV